MAKVPTPGLLQPPGPDVFRLFECTSLLLGRAYLVVVPLDLEAGVLTCEAHLLVEKSQSRPIRAQRFRVGSTSFRLDDEERAIVDIVDIAKGWADGDLGDEQLKVAQDHSAGLYPMPPSFAPSESSLAYLWLRRFLSQGLRTIAERTESKPLKVYLERLFQVPQVVTKPF